jgi:hypothetical protein
MKKQFIALFVILSLMLVLPVFAQNNDESDMYYINIPVERIFSTKDGFIIQYRQASSLIGTIGIPHVWFSAAGGKAEMIRLPRGRNWPSMSVFYKNGEFSHVRLYVHHNRGHQTWSTVPQAADVSRYFEDTENFNIVF